MIAEEKITAFVQFADEELGVAATEDDVARTREPLSNFIDACREIKTRKDAAMPDGTPVTVLYGSQRFIGAAPKDIVIADFGDARAVLFF